MIGRGDTTARRSRARCLGDTPAHGPRQGASHRRRSGRSATSTRSDAHTVTFAIGPAGTGKTLPRDGDRRPARCRTTQVAAIILTRPAVEAGERLGFLPGTLYEKIDPYLRPLYDALFEMTGADTLPRLMERGHRSRSRRCAYMRGRTLNDAFIILDEAQNTTPEQMKMFLTRIGFGSKAVVTGDVTQVDLAAGQLTGLAVVEEIPRRHRRDRLLPPRRARRGAATRSCRTSWRPTGVFGEQRHAQADG